MERQEAIKYLKRKGKITPENFDEKLVEQVEREGKIFGDPIVDIKK